MVETGVQGGTVRYGVDVWPGSPWGLLFGLQHVLVMFTATVGSPLIISQALDLPAGVRTDMITGCMLGCGITTVLMTVGLGPLGARLPLMMGIFAIFIPPTVSVARVEGLPAAFSALAGCGVLAFLLTPLIAKVRLLFTPIVIGTVLLVISISLMRIATNVALGTNTPHFASSWSFCFLFGSIGLILLINRASRGSVKTLAIFCAVVIAYVVASAVGLSDFSRVSQASWFRIPAWSPFGMLTWPSLEAILTFVPYYLVTAAETVSMSLAVSSVAGVQPSERAARGAVSADCLGSAIAGTFGGLPMTAYSQNVGLVSLSGVASRLVVAVAGLVLIIMAFFPKVGAVIGMVPPFVMGGALLFIFGSIAAVGIGIIATHLVSQREILVVATSLGLGASVVFAPPGTFNALPSSVRLLASDGIIVGMVSAILLDLILPVDEVAKKE